MNWSLGAAMTCWSNVHLGEELFGHILYLPLQDRSKTPTLHQHLQPSARSVGEVCSTHWSCSFSSLIVLATLQDQQETCSHVNGCLMSPMFYSPLNEEQICIDFRTTRAVNYWS